MEAKIIDGKAIAQEIKQKLKLQVDNLKQEEIYPGLAMITVGNDPASSIYINSKKKACEEIGIVSEEYTLNSTTTQEELVSLIEILNERDTVSGIIVQQPIPKHINVDAINSAINPLKDVDAFHPVNIGKFMVGSPIFVPCTPAGVVELIKQACVDIKGKECVVVGRSNIVGKPLAALLLANDATVTVCHSKTVNLKEVCLRADILVSAVGKPGIIDGCMIKPGAVVIDVGISRTEGSKKIKGDVDFESAIKVAGAITPVPGGVGPMTIAMLMKNTVVATIMALRRDTCPK